MASTKKRGFLPDTDAGLLAWSLHFSTLLTASPTTYGVTAAIASAYASVHSAFASALAACDPNVRNKTSVAAKNTARDTLREQARAIGGQIEKMLTVSDADKIELGLTVRKQPSPIPIPTAIPTIDIVSVNGRTVVLRVHSDDENRRGKPEGVAGAQIHSFVGTTPPEDPEEWVFQGSITALNHVPVEFPLSVAAGSQVWFKACFFNPRNQCGAPSAATPTYLQYGSSSMAA